MWLPIYPAPPATRTVMLEPRSYFEIVASFAHRNTAHDNRFECPMQIPRNKRRKLASAASASSARRRLFSNSGKGSVIAPRPMITGGTDGADGADGTDRLFSC